MNLLFTLDHGYLKVLAKCLRSIRRFATKGGYDVYILHTDLTDKDMEQLEEDIRVPSKGSICWEDIHLHPIYVEPSTMDLFPDSARYPKTMYIRLFAANLLPAGLDRILYLDPDIIVIKSLTSLYERDFEDDLFFWACTHTKKFLTGVNRIRLDLPKEAPYINTGVLLMNLPLLRQEQRMEDVKEYVKKRELLFVLPDQDILSALYGERTGLLDSLRYNLSDRIIMLHNTTEPLMEKVDLDWVKHNTVIIHYFGRNKPWKDNYWGILKCFYDEV